MVGKTNEELYKTDCALHGCCPIKSIINFLDDGIVDINVDKVQPTDWPPICNLFKSASDLKFIALRSFRKNGSSKINRNIVASIPKLEIYSELISYLCTAVVHNAKHLTCLEFQNIQLSKENLSLLALVLPKSKCLTHLSFQQCSIKDDGFKILSKALKKCLTITSINLTNCDLTWKGIENVVKVLKHQSIIRQSNEWEETLRERSADLHATRGIQRITLNGNIDIGDKGVKLLSEMLKEDVWLKALDMQECSIKDGGAKAFLNSLKQNSTLYILDVRKNLILDRQLLVRIGQQLNFNTQGNPAQFKWLMTKSKHNMFPTTGNKKCDIPWRVSARFSSLKQLPYHVPGIANVFLLSNPNLFDHVIEENGNKFRKNKANSRKSLGNNEIILDDITKQLMDLKILFEKERETSQAAEKRIEELTLENEELKQKLSKDQTVTLLDNSTLNTIELTFAKFNDFLRLLKTSSSKDSESSTNAGSAEVSALNNT